jgi:hypothetical protein
MADDRTLVLDAVKNFLGSISHHHPPFTSTRTHVLESSFCVLSHPNELVLGTVGECISRVEETIGRILESGAHSVVEALTGHAPEVWIYQDLAAVMAGYSVLVDGVEVSGGVNLFSLLKTSRGWKIAGIADTQWPGASKVPPVLHEPASGVITAIETFFEHLKVKNWEGMLQDFLPGGGITNSRSQGIIFSNWLGLIDRLREVASQTPPGSVMEEIIFDLEYRTVGDVAFAWTPFRVDLDGVPQSKGVNIMTLLKREEGWVISGVQDTGRPCDGPMVGSFRC